LQLAPDRRQGGEGLPQQRTKGVARGAGPISGRMSVGKPGPGGRRAPGVSGNLPEGRPPTQKAGSRVLLVPENPAGRWAPARHGSGTDALGLTRGDGTTTGKQSFLGRAPRADQGKKNMGFVEPSPAGGREVRGNQTAYKRDEILGTPRRPKALPVRRVAGPRPRDGTSQDGRCSCYHRRCTRFALRTAVDPAS